MACRMFIAATGQHCGKTTTSIALLHLARERHLRIGFIKPLGPKPIMLKGIAVDRDAALIAQVFDLEGDLSRMSPAVLHSDTTKRVIDGEMNPEVFAEQIAAAGAEIESKCDVLVIEGAGHSGVGAVMGLCNARIARMLDAPVLMVAEGGVGRVIDAVSLNLSRFREQGVEVRGIVANKLHSSKRDSSLAYLARAFRQEPFAIFGGFDDQPLLSGPTLRHLAKVLDVSSAKCGQECSIVQRVEIAEGSAEQFVKSLQAATLLIVSGSRSDLLIALAERYQQPEYRRKIAGLALPGAPPMGETLQVLEACGIPYLCADHLSISELHRRILADVPKITAEDEEKLALIRQLAARHFDFDDLLATFTAPKLHPSARPKSLALEQIRTLLRQT